MFLLNLRLDLCSVSEERRLLQIYWKDGTRDTLTITTLARIYLLQKHPPPSPPLPRTPSPPLQD